MPVRSALAGLLVALLCLVGSAQGGKLLVIPVDGSHWTGMKPLVEELGRRGHQVVVLIPEASLSMGPSDHTTTLTFPVPYTRDHMTKDLDKNLGKFMEIDVSTTAAKAMNYWFTTVMLSNITMITCEHLLYNKELMQTLRDHDFDALLTDPFWPVGVIAGAYLNLPSVYVVFPGSLPCPIDMMATRCPSPVSYIPRRYTHYSNRMNFWERSVNMVKALVEPAACNRIYLHADEVASDVLQRKTSIPELASNAALWLVRSSFVLEYPIPLMPNMVMVGGMKAKKPKPLPLALNMYFTKATGPQYVLLYQGSKLLHFHCHE